MITQRTMQPRVWAELFVLSFIWGGSFLSVRIALDEIGPLTSVAHRVVWAMLILWAYVWLRGLHVPRSRRVWIGFLGMGLLNNVIPFSLMAWGQLYIETGLTSILNAATAIFGVIAAAIFFADERLTAQRAIGVTLGFLGVATAVGLSSLTYYRVLAAAGAGNLMLCTLLVAPVAIILGAVVLDEALPLRAYAGFALLAAGLVILNRKPR